MISYLATATLAIGALLAAPQPPQWEASYGKALEATREGGRPAAGRARQAQQPKMHGSSRRCLAKRWTERRTSNC